MSFDNFRVQRYLYCKTVCVFTIWLGPRANMIKQILGSDKTIKKLLIDVACSVKMAKY